MAKLLLNLYRAPDDEAEDVRRLLDQHKLQWYETLPSMWGVSHGGIWLRHDEDFPEAARLLQAYESDRSQRVRAEFAAARAAGTAPTFWSLLRAHPGYVLACLVAIAFALAIVAVPVWLLL